MYDSTKMFLSSSSHSPKNNPRQKISQPSIGFEFPTDAEDALFVIWQKFKTILHAQCPTEIRQERCRAVRLMIQCHKILKLPLETLYLAVSVLEKILITNYHTKDSNFDQDIDINILGIGCLYSCQKLEKIRNYGVSYWLKHLSQEVLSSVGYPGISISADSLKKYEAYIMQKMNYNLFCSTIFDLLLGIWTLKSPTQHQFYFCQYLLELSLFVQFNIFKKGAFTTSNTATSTNQAIQIQNQQNETTSKIYLLDIILAILSLSFHFFPNDQLNLETLIKTIWKEYQKQQNSKYYEQKVKKIKAMANLIFERACNAVTDPNCQSTVTKYAKQVNMGISNFKFQVKSDKFSNCENQKRQGSAQFEGYQRSTVYQTF